MRVENEIRLIKGLTGNKKKSKSDPYTKVKENRGQLQVRERCCCICGSAVEVVMSLRGLRDEYYSLRRIDRDNIVGGAPVTDTGSSFF